MIRKIEKKDRDVFLRFSEMFYASPAVAHEIPKEYHERAFAELMRSDEYADGYIVEADGKPVGIALTAKTYSREAGEKFCGWKSCLFSKNTAAWGWAENISPLSKNTQGITALRASAWKWKRKTCGHARCTAGSGTNLSDTSRWSKNCRFEKVLRIGTLL